MRSSTFQSSCFDELLYGELEFGLKLALPTLFIAGNYLAFAHVVASTHKAQY